MVVDLLQVDTYFNVCAMLCFGSRTATLANQRYLHALRECDEAHRDRHGAFCLLPPSTVVSFWFSSSFPLPNDCGNVGRIVIWWRALRLVVAISRRRQVCVICS